MLLTPSLRVVLLCYMLMPAPRAATMIFATRVIAVAELLRVAAVYTPLCCYCHDASPFTIRRYSLITRLLPAFTPPRHAMLTPFRCRHVA